MAEAVEFHGIEYHYDGMSDGFAGGWALYKNSSEKAVALTVDLNGTRYATIIADRYRGDLEAANKRGGRCAFNIDLRQDTLQKRGALDHKEDEELLLFCKVSIVDEGETQHVATIRLDFRPEIASAPKMTRVFAEYFGSDFSQDKTAVYDKQLRITPPGRMQKLAPIFAPAFDIHSNEGGATLALSKGLDFTRKRMRVDQHFKPQEHKDDYDRYLKWYIDFDSVRRKPLRVPFSRFEIAYLNEGLFIGSPTFKLSRLTCYYLNERADLIGGIAAGNAEVYDALCCWWIFEKAILLGVEDILVPHYYSEHVTRVSAFWVNLPYPLTRWMEIIFARSQFLHFLDLQLVGDRIVFYAYLLFRARAGELPFAACLPRQWVQTLLSETQTSDNIMLELLELDLEKARLKSKQGELDRDERFFEIKRHEAKFGEATSAALKNDLLRLGFDLNSGRYLFTGPEGDRIHANKMSRLIPLRDKVDLQLIGPIEKSSGLGQATRISAEILNNTGLDFVTFDFGLDNPAPHQATPNVSEFLHRSSINLIHLNAESTPLAFQYLPDCFSSSYNIGYFFWELNSPASCHSLALDLLDEIWVSSEYGVETYRNYTSKPVINVGMAFQRVEPVTREDARTFVSRKTNVGEDTFVVFVAFDAFSFVQRKNPLGVLRAFKKAFSPEDDVLLVIKTHNRKFVADPIQQKVWNEAVHLMGDSHQFVFIDETLSYSDFLKLKCGSDCYFSLHKSEGWGFGMIEAMSLGVPVIATGYSGNMEFCNPETAWLVDYKEKMVREDDYIFTQPGQFWADPDEAHAAAQLRYVFEHRAEARTKADYARQYVEERFSVEAIARRYRARFMEIAEAQGMTGFGTTPKQDRTPAKPVEIAKYVERADDVDRIAAAALAATPKPAAESPPTAQPTTAAEPVPSVTIAPETARSTEDAESAAEEAHAAKHGHPSEETHSADDVHSGEAAHPAEDEHSTEDVHPAADAHSTKAADASEHTHSGEIHPAGAVHSGEIHSGGAVHAVGAIGATNGADAIADVQTAESVQSTPPTEDAARSRPFSFWR